VKFLRKLAPLLGTLALAPASARADVHPNTQSGFAPEQAFAVGEIDNVNLFNGSLVVTIPIGMSYPVASGFSYRLALVHNMNPWEFFGHIAGNGLPELTQGIPQPDSNAGLGWRLSLGQIKGKFLYAGPDGAEHLFSPTLHPGDAPENGVAYTRDGSYLRRRVVAGGMEIDFPDGTIHHFDGLGRLASMRDAFGNRVDVSYATAGRWILTDSRGRTQTIVFRNDLPGYLETVDRVELMGAGPTPSVYNFSYTVQEIGRGCPHSDAVSVGKTVTVPLLTSISLPDGSSYRMSPSDYITAWPTGTAECTDNSGSLLGISLPTLGRLEWTYQDYRFPDDSSPQGWRRKKPGVATRTMRDPNGTALGTWSYATGYQGQALVNTVTNPLGQRTVRYFSASTTLALTGWSRYDYAMPFTRDVTSGGLFLSSRTYEAGGQLLRSEYVRYERDEVVWAAFLPDAQNNNRRPQASRTVYDDDGGTYAEVTSADFDGLGHYRSQQTDGNFPGSNYRGHFAAFNPGQGTYTVNAAANAVAPGFTMKPSSQPWALGTMAYDWDFENGAYAYRDHCYFPGTQSEVRTRIHRQDGATQSANDLVVAYDLISSTGDVQSESYYGGDAQGGIPTSTGNPCTMALPAVPEYQIDHTYSNGVRATSQYPATGLKVLDRTIHATGLTVASRDTAGIGTSYEYDAMGRLTWSKPDAGHGGYTQYVYGAADPLTATRAGVVIRRRGNGSTGAPILQTSQITFDFFGRVFREQQSLPGGGFNLRETLYDPAGNKDSVSEVESGAITRRTQFLSYDPFGRPRIIQPPDGPSHSVTMAYKGTRQVERTVQVATGAGGAETAAKTTEIYDRHGRLAQVLEPSGTGGALTTTSYSYDVTNKLSLVSMYGGSTSQTRNFLYDRAGLLISETHPEKGTSGNGTVSYPRYDSRGNVLRKADGPNDLTFFYDASERLYRVRETGGAQRNLKTFTYASANSTGDWRQGKLYQQSRFNYTNISGTPFTVELRETMTYGGRDGRISARRLENFVNGAAAPNEAFDLANLTYDPLGNLQQFDYPKCIHAACTAPAPRTVINSYSEGLLTAVGVPGTPGYYASAITYHPNLQVNQVVHTNNPADASKSLTDTQANDPNAMRRPASIAVTTVGGATRWSTGAYTYDGAGNVKSIGTHAFGYDKVSRLTSASLYLEPTSSVTPIAQSYTYDAFGNLQSIGGSAGRNTPTTSATNRLTGGIYDAAGNLTTWNGNLYEYDGFNQMSRYKTPSDEWVYLYTADDERAWSFKIGGTDSRWYLRGLGGQLLREYAATGSWRVDADSIYRDGLLLATETPLGTRHFHLDHLGTPRLVSDNLGQQKAYHVYYPYGDEATAFNQDTIRTKFTGHERDLGNPGGAGDDLDYMHARHCSPVSGRFLSFDPIGGNLRAPQSWNRYSYVMNRPLVYTDPEGLFAILSQPPQVGMPLEDYGYAMGVTVTASTGTGRSINPIAGMRGLISLTNGRILGSPQSLNELRRIARGLDSLIYFQAHPSIISARALAEHQEILAVGDLGDEIVNAMEPGLAFYGAAAFGNGEVAVSPNSAGLGRSLGSQLFRKGGLLNSNRYFRIGFGRAGGRRVFRLAGQIVQKVAGREHIDIWRGGPL
jgi:RHS repeat-associated protein